MSTRLERLKEILTSEGIEAMLVSKPENIFYISGFTGEGWVLVTMNGAAVITDPRYTEQAEKEAPGFDILEFKNNIHPFKIIDDYLKQNYIKYLAFESHVVTVKEYANLESCLKNVHLYAFENLVEKLRLIKDVDEILAIRKAQKITDQTFAHILQYIKDGVSEEEIALEMEYFMKKQGASGVAFEIIVASGKNSSLPHAKPTKKKLQKGDFIILDFGARFKNYCSDMTRTIFLGNVDGTQKRIYNTVLKAQEAALEHIKSGVLGKDVDKKARDVIEKNGFGSNFGHGLGHGVGIEIHEGPRLSPKGDVELLPNMVVTVEPGIYIRDYGGVRIEDLVIVTEQGYQNLTTSPKNLVII